MTAVRTDLKTWPQLLPFRQPMLTRSPSRDFVIPAFLSVVLHAFLVFLLGVVVTDRTAFEPTAPSIDTHLIVSLTTFDTASQNELDREAVSVVPNTGPPVQHSQSSPERSRSAERKAEAESIVASKGQGIPGSDTPDGKSLATDEIPSIDLEADYRIVWEFGRTSELEFETVVTSIGLGIPGLKALDGKSIATDAIPLTDLDSIFRRIAREGKWMSESEVLRQRYELQMLFKKNYEASLPQDCHAAYAKMGLLAIPFLIRDAITSDGCKW